MGFEVEWMGHDVQQCVLWAVSAQKDPFGALQLSPTFSHSRIPQLICHRQLRKLRELPLRTKRGEYDQTLRHQPVNSTLSDSISRPLILYFCLISKLVSARIWLQSWTVSASEVYVFWFVAFVCREAHRRMLRVFSSVFLFGHNFEYDSICVFVIHFFQCRHRKLGFEEIYRNLWTDEMFSGTNFIVSVDHHAYGLDVKII